MAGANFENDYGSGIVTADGFAVIGASGAPINVITAGGDYVADSITFAPALSGIPTYVIDSVSVGLPSYTVAQANALSPQPATGSLIYVSNGNAGAACLAVRSGGAWLRIALGAAISAT